MKSIARSLIVVLVALIAVPALVVTATITTAVQLLATTVLIMGGTEHPLSLPTDGSDFVTAYMDQAINNYIDPGGTPSNPADYNRVAVIYPAEFFPVFGSTTFDDSVKDGVDNLGSCLGRGPNAACDYNHDVNSTPPDPSTDDFIVYGYSQSAVVASLVKNDIINDRDTALDGTQFYLISNPMRPNGGILGRGFEGMTIPIIGITFYGPTENSCPPAGCADDDPLDLPTVDVAQQYDFLGGDAPARPLNLLAMANSLAAYAQLHGDVPTHQIGEDGMIDQGQYGDTQYYLIAAERLPILMPLGGIVPDPILAVIDAPLRVLIEDAYVRDTSPGQHVQFQILPIGDPVKLVANLVGSIPVGIDDGLQEAGVGRALGTNDVDRPFGVGGETYEKGTGAPAGVETGGNVFTDPVAPNTVGTQSQTQPLRIASGPVGGDLQPEVNKDSQTEESGNVVSQQTDTTPVVTRPRPLQIVRDSLNFDPSKRPAATPPSGNGPLRQIVKALTGQKPNTTTSTEANNEESNPAA
jgi:hypothetical protein